MKMLIYDSSKQTTVQKPLSKVYIEDAQQGHVMELEYLFRIDNRRENPCSILLLRCYHCTSGFSSVIHSMRLFASLQRLGGSGLMKMIVSLGKLPKLHIKEVIIRKLGDAQ